MWLFLPPVHSVVEQLRSELEGLYAISQELKKTDTRTNTEIETLKENILTVKKGKPMTNVIENKDFF